jgi:hypothetical protein
VEVPDYLSPSNPIHMKKVFTLFLAFALAGLQVPVQAQRYLSEVFDDVTVTTDVTYGVNATVLYVCRHSMRPFPN